MSFTRSVRTGFDCSQPPVGAAVSRVPVHRPRTTRGFSRWKPASAGRLTQVCIIPIGRSPVDKCTAAGPSDAEMQVRSQPLHLLAMHRTMSSHTHTPRQLPAAATFWRWRLAPTASSLPLPPSLPPSFPPSLLPSLLPLSTPPDNNSSRLPLLAARVTLPHFSCPPAVFSRPSSSRRRLPTTQR